MNRKGLTLIEILIVVAILSIMAVCFKTVFMVGLTSWNKAVTKADIYQNMRVAIDQISQDLASAIAIAGVPSFKGISPASGADSVSLIIVRECTIYEVTYALNNELLERTYDEDADCDFSTTDEVHKLASGISDIQFKYWDTGTTAWEGAGATAAEDNWTDDWTNTGGPRPDLPRAVRITLTDSKEGQRFETIVYLPNS